MITKKSEIKMQNAKLRNIKMCNLSGLRRVPQDGQFVICNSRNKGFTLLELIVVIFIISIAAAIIMPSLPWAERDMLKKESRRISSALRYVYDEATSKKQIYLFNINIDHKSWGFKGEKESRNFEIRGDVKIKDVIVPSHGEISRGELTIEFGPMGPDEPIILHLKKDESEYTVIFNHLSGRTKILEGYEL